MSFAHDAKSTAASVASMVVFNLLLVSFCVVVCEPFTRLILGFTATLISVGEFRARALETVFI